MASAGLIFIGTGHPKIIGDVYGIRMSGQSTLMRTDLTLFLYRMFKANKLKNNCMKEYKPESVPIRECATKALSRRTK